jgi:hypothetical protein
MTRELVLAAANAPQPSVLSAHLWHIVEAVAFLVTSLGGIAVAEFVQGRNRRPGNVAQFSGSASSSARSTEAWGTDAFVQTSPAAGLLEAGRRVTLLPLVALAGAGAAGVHAVVMPEHFEESWLYGTFFLVAALAQLSYSAWLLVRPSRELLIVGLAGNLSIVVLWLVTRTVGIPLGPAAGTTEEFGGLDMLAAFFELATALGAVLLLRRGGPLRSVRPSAWSPPVWVLGSVAITAIAITALVAPPS